MRTRAFYRLGMAVVGTGVVLVMALFGVGFGDAQIAPGSSLVSVIAFVLVPASLVVGLVIAGAVWLGWR